ncbi:hypothetical protein IQ249_04360 [Lusitaniella coriacea LEGE 07157]|uniref:Leucine rich repeat variant domain-containing protein n=1 Tax=Lusitaniella coriacea LEGE 07157 TaxID=945747 RepID=A0A8J7B3K1_9CYAN|nr:hypothetical protein [Lusitaniella coriacea]MBE9115127.1 hypothetical protein [Lusitaniella coriacea LEGE 07157]
MKKPSLELLRQQQEASNEQTPPQRLAQLASISIEFARLVAQNPTAPVDLLAKLSKSDDKLTRQSVTANPNTRIEILLRLGREFPKEFLENPVFLLICLENPNFVQTIPEDTLSRLLRCQDAPLFLLERAASYPERRIRTQAVDRAPLNFLAKLVQNPYEDVRMVIAENPKIPIPLLEQLGSDESVWVRCTVAAHPQTPIGVLEQLSRDESEEVRRIVAAHSQTPIRILEQLARDRDREVRWSVAAHKQVSPSSLEVLARDLDSQIRCAVAKNPNTPPELLSVLQTDETPSVSRWAKYHLKRMALK